MTYGLRFYNMKYIISCFVVAFVVLCPGVANAQLNVKPDTLKVTERGKVALKDAKGRVDHYLDLRDSLMGPKSLVDTAYLAYPEEQLRMKLSLSGGGSFISLNGNVQGTDFATSLSALQATSVSLQACYRNLSLSIGLPHMDVSGSNDFLLGFSAYGSKMGADIVYNNADSYSGTTKAMGRSADIEQGSVSSRTLMLSGYYVFNDKRFSIPAAFSQSMIQKKSSGSVMLSGTIRDQKLHVESANEVIGAPQWLYCHTTYIAVGGGYGYNLVLPNDWLVHISTLSELFLLKRSRFRAQDVQRHLPSHFPSLVGTVRVAGIHSFNRYYLGGTFLFSYGNVGKSGELELGYSQWHFRTFFGVRI